MKKAAALALAAVPAMPASRYYLPYMEVDLTNRCNLNCARCTHFSPLANSNPMDYDLAQFEADMAELSSKFAIGFFRLLGGEPFLVKDVVEYSKIVRTNFPYTSIQIMTNGTMKDKINAILPELKKFGVTISVSGYENYTKISAGTDVKVKKTSRFRGLGLNLIPMHNPQLSKDRCTSNQRVTVYNGRLYLCPIVKNLETLEKAFNIDFNLSIEDRSVDLYTNSAEQIFLKLGDENYWGKLCSHCPSKCKQYPWGLSERKIEEWVDMEEK